MRTFTLAVATAVVQLAFALPAAADVHAVADDEVGAAELLAKVRTCRPISRGRYRTGGRSAATVPVCGLDGAVFWKAGLGIDCDGQAGAVCNRRTDPWFQGDTAFHQSNGKPLKAEKLPYAVVPGPSPVWQYSSAGIRGGAVAAVVYQGRVEYAVVGDTGPVELIGEASYATAEALGIDPDPVTGGVASGVTYILFSNSRVDPIESHSEAIALGTRLARAFIENN